MKHIIVGFLLFLLAACGTSQTHIVQPAILHTPFTVATLVKEDDLVPVHKELEAEMDQLMAKYFFETPGAFKQATDGLQIKYRFIQLDPGKRYQRWLSTGIGNWGAGLAIIEIWFVDPSGAELARIKIDGTVSAGGAGGSAAAMLERVAKEASRYALANFH